jgi:signal transduction histidine kinase
MGACHNTGVRESRIASVRLWGLFVLLSVVPLVVLGFLGWRLVEQDRALETQRLRERLDNSAALIVHELDRRFAEWEGFLEKSSESQRAEVPLKTAYFLISAHTASDHRGQPIAFFPSLPPVVDLPSHIFADAEAAEFREGDHAKAAISYRALTRDSNPRIQAAAWVRLARCWRKLDRMTDALEAYATLAALSSTPVAGAPAELVAQRERIALFQLLRDPKRFEREAQLLSAALTAGRFDIDRPTFDFYAESVGRPLPATAAIHLAHAVEAMWPGWQQQPSGRSAHHAERAFAAVWRQTLAGTAVLVGDLDSLIEPANSMLNNLQVQLALEDSSGRSAWGRVAPTATAVIKRSRETGLPWTIRVAPQNEIAQAAWGSRRNVLLAGFALMALVIAAASYAVFRAVNRELRVARLQSDFVSAVSHEFRTPLTAMRHLVEMLEEGRVAADRSRQYYEALGRETRRLHALVESLLDFGRMESGRRVYHLEETKAAELAERVVGEFRQRPTISAHRLELNVAPAESHQWRVRVDREALSLALGNLLDNAIKYSPEASTVQVSLDAHDGMAGIAVLDAGPGIGEEEQRAVFRKFVRGAAARTLNVKGTGIGLTMADEIVRAHGGRLELASKPGQGSRFTILLPLLNRTSSLTRSREAANG